MIVLADSTAIRGLLTLWKVPLYATLAECRSLLYNVPAARTSALRSWRFLPAGKYTREASTWFPWARGTARRPSHRRTDHTHGRGGILRTCFDRFSIVNNYWRHNVNENLCSWTQGGCELAGGSRQFSLGKQMPEYIGGSALRRMSGKPPLKLKSF